MSWSAHDLEPYAIQKHSRIKLAFVPLLIGSYSPDMMSKWFVYGIHLGPWELKAHDPAQFHRGWPGVGFTHSLLYGVVICLLIWKVAGSKTWGISFLVGEWAHALTDTGDTVGTMLLFPWTQHFHLDAGPTRARRAGSPTPPPTSAGWDRCGTRSSSSTGSTAGAC